MRFQISHWRSYIAVTLLVLFTWLNLGRLFYITVQERVILDTAIADNKRMIKARTLISSDESVGFISDDTTSNTTIARQLMMAQHVFTPTLIQWLPNPPQRLNTVPDRILVMSQSDTLSQTIQALYGLREIQRIDEQLVILGK
ncbi:MAG: hypothetical protein KAX40_05645 [Herpetosiphon sp.]|nr:hypothetical protein [Herpetosiphon sp.]